MRENKAKGAAAARAVLLPDRSLFGKPSSSCSRPAKEEVDGLLLCERHALEAKLEGQIECWGGMLFHIDLWSREASRRERADVVGLLEDQRTQATSARQRAYEDLDVAQERDALGTAEESRSRRGSLPPSSKRRPAALSRASTSST